MLELPPNADEETTVKYLASPYSHEDPAIRAFRFEAAVQTAANIIMRGIPVVSPIAHSHYIFVTRPETGSDFEAWREVDETLLLACDEMWILDLPGWNVSNGIREEAKIALANGMPVKLVDRDGNIVEEV